MLNAAGRAGPEFARLGFTLPSFTRMVWVSEAARLAWAPQVEKIQQAWQQAEWRSVCAGLRPCAFLQYYSDRYAEAYGEWRRHGLKVEPLQMARKADGRYFVNAAVGAKHAARWFKKAWIRRDHDEMGKLLGYPECCRAYFRTWFEERRLNDPTWLIAQNRGWVAVQGAIVTAYGDPLTNILHRYCGVRAVPHLPCGFECAASHDFAERLLALYPELGYAEQAQRLREMLDWPMEWTALHGILELRTPLLKLAANTDASAEKLTVRWLGRTIPAGAARGLGFPYDAIQGAES